MKISELGVTSNEGQDPVEVELSIECGLDESLLNFGSKKVKGHVLNMTALLTLTSDMDFIDFRRIPTRVLKDHKKFELTAQLTRPSQSVLVIIASETFAGTAIQQLYKPRLSAKEFPVMNTRPPTSINLDLAGLEEDPDFWNMDLEDEEVIPIRDLTKNRKSKTSGTPSSKKKQSNILRTLDPLINDPEKLVNGNYECNHTCKDKTICRHLCCREGVGMPSKKRSAAAAKQARGSAITKPKTITAVHTPAARRFNDLEELHEKMNVTSNLGLPQGHRLKLDSPEQLRRKRRPFQDFNIDFADLNNTLSQATETQYDGNDTDNDDLPESHDILKTISTAIKARTPPLETNYSDSDLDSLIRAAPLDDNQEVTVAKFTMSKNDIKRPKHQPRSLVACPSTPLPTLKRNREACSTSPPFERHNKLPKTVGTCSSPLDSGPYAMISQDLHTYDEADPLFNISFGSPAEVIMRDEWFAKTHMDNFFLGSDSIDAGLSTTLTIAATEDDAKSSSQASISDRSHVNTSDTGVANNKGGDHFVDQKIENEEDEFAELDAWFASGAVEIL